MAVSSTQTYMPPFSFVVEKTVTMFAPTFPAKPLRFTLITLTSLTFPLLNQTLWPGGKNKVMPSPIAFLSKCRKLRYLYKPVKEHKLRKWA